MTTDDGSKTIHMPDLNEQYHSKHGALQEARHVFISMGLEYYISAISKAPKQLRILEYGFGTGLNAMLTAMQNVPFTISYTGIEAFPVNEEEIQAMDYGKLLQEEELYNKLHQAEWQKPVLIKEGFELFKRQMTFEEIDFVAAFDLIYFDAFGPRTQPELWTLEIFKAAFTTLDTDGVLVTYCAAGQVRRNLELAGFTVDRLPGPPGKREMLRGRKF